MKKLKVFKDEMMKDPNFESGIKLDDVLNLICSYVNYRLKSKSEFKFEVGDVKFKIIDDVLFTDSDQPKNLGKINHLSPKQLLSLLEDNSYGGRIIF